MRVFLVAGKARSGKTEVAKILKEYLEEKNLKVVISEYSKYIKLFAKELIGWDGVSEPKPRKFLQDFGFYIRHESKDANYFIRRMKEDLMIYKDIVDVVIISDVRLPSEILELQEYSPITIKVDSNLRAYDLTKEEASHETEHALDSFDDFDYFIKDQSLEEMKLLVKKIVEECF